MGNISGKILMSLTPCLLMAVTNSDNNDFYALYGTLNLNLFYI